MTKINSSGLILLIARLAVAATFLMASLPKLQAPLEFAESVSAFQLIGPVASLWVAITLPWLELISGIGLVIPQIRRSSAFIISLLLLLFIGLHVSAWNRGLDISCGCFGAHEDLTADYTWPILRNVILLCATIAIAIRDFRHHSRLKTPKA